MTDAQRELKPCPFCGREPRLVDLAGWEIVCNCGVNLCLAIPYKQNAIEAWNTRAAEAQQQARIDWLVSALKDLPWRIEDIADALQSRGVGDQRIYGCDEWSTPVLNLNTMLGKVNKAILSAGGEVK